MLIHDLYPVAARRARRARRSTACGPTWSPTAATSSSSASTPGSRASGSRAAATAARPRRRRSSSRSSRRSTSTAPDLEGLVVEGVVRGRRERASRATSALELPVDAGSRPGQRRGRARLAGSTWPASATSPRATASCGIERARASRLVVAQGRGRRCSPTATRAPTAASRSRGRALTEGVLACPSCERRYFLPRAGRSMDDERLQLEPVPLLDGDGGRRGWLSRHERRHRTAGCARTARRPSWSAGLRRAAGGVSPRDSRARASDRGGSARRPRDRREHCDALRQAGIPAEHRHLLHLDERRILCACESCLAMRGGRRRATARPGPGPSGSTDFDLPDELWATFAIPIGLAFFLTRASVGQRRRDVPEPGGRHRVRARARAWQELAEHEPGAGRSSPTPRR